MQISAGQRLGAYEVVSKLGAGGMGEVWRARDARLHRSVALKVLPPGLAGNPDRLTRFHREARLLAALSHSGIATLFGFEEIDGQPVLVMELVEGETLAERLRRGPMPVDESLDVARKVAEALEEAHEKGIVHRDLKPANVKTTPDGKVKVLDFGLAKAFASDGLDQGPDQANDLSDSPTRTEGTHAGVILGTAAYMAPEQARGAPVDKRADIFAFGALLFEMLSGRRAFPGETLSDMLAAVLRAEPDWSALPTGTPARVRALLHRCLEKVPALRLRDIGEARISLLADRAAQEVTGGAIGDAEPRPRRARVVALATATALGGALLAAAALRWAPAPRAAETLRFGAVTNSPGIEAQPSLSSDGRSLVFVSNRSGQFDLWIRLVAGGRLLQITNDRNLDADPRWSPDGSQIAFSKLGDNGRWDVWMVSALGDEPRRVIADAREPDWSPDGRSLVYADMRTRTISRADATGGQARAITQLEPDTPTRPNRYGSHRRPAFSHDGRRVAFERRIGGPFVDLGMVDLGTGRQVALTQETRLAASPAWSADDRWIYYASSRGGTDNIWKIGSTGGSPLQVTVGQGDDTEPSLSPDGKRMAFATHRAKYGIGEISLDAQDAGDPKVRWLTSDTASGAQAPAYSPDGERIAFFSLRPGGESESTVWVIGRDGQNATPALRDGYRNIFPRWSRDGASLVFHSWSDEADIGIRRANLTGGPPEVITPEFFFTPDPDHRGRLIGWLPGGHARLYDPATQQTVTVEAIAGTKALTGAGFRWSPDGKRVAFMTPPGSEAPGAWIYDFTNPPQRAFEGWVAGLAWTAPDALYVAEARSDLRASLWRVQPATLARERLRPWLSVGYNYWDQELAVYFDVSPDGRRVATMAMEQWEADIGMIEGFR